MTDGRTHRPQLTAVLGDGLTVRAPAVGLWRSGPAVGALVRPGDEIGELEILGVLHKLVAPAKAAGVVADDDRPRQAPLPVEYGAVLFTLDPEAVAGALGAAAAAQGGEAEGSGLHFCSPLSGRFYTRAAPDKPPFVSPGDEIAEGQTIGLLEVMKTFNRLTYGGEGLPARARVKAILPENEADLDQGDPILDLEPI